MKITHLYCTSCHDDILSKECKCEKPAKHYETGSSILFERKVEELQEIRAAVWIEVLTYLRGAAIAFDYGTNEAFIMVREYLEEEAERRGIDIWGKDPKSGAI